MLSKEDRKQGLLQKLMREAMNRRQIKDVMFCTQQTADNYIAELRAEGRIYVAFYNRTVGMPSPYFLAGQGFDAPKPKALTQAEYNARNEARLKAGDPSPKVEAVELVEPKFKPRRDIAANWF